MHLTRLIYASRPRYAMTPDDAGKILDISRRNNQRDGITGILCFDRHYFFQCLEGGRDMVNQTYHRIATDNRHHDLLLISYLEISKRLFSNWTMGYVSLDEEIKRTLFAHHASVEFNPYVISVNSAEAMMESMSYSLPTI